MIRSMIKNACVKRKISPFIILPFLFLATSFALPFVIGIFVFACSDFYFSPDRIPWYLLLAVFVYLLLAIDYLTQSKELRKESHDRKHGHLRKEIVMWTSAESLSRGCYRFLPNLVSFFSYSEEALYKKVWFCRENGETGYFYDIITAAKVEGLKALYHTQTEYWKKRERAKHLTFDGDLRVMITYGEKSHVLIDASPVTGEEYSEKQLRAIDQLSRRYLTKDLFKRNSSCEKSDSPLSLTPPILVMLIPLSILFALFLSGSVSLVVNVFQGDRFAYFLLLLSLGVFFAKLICLTFSFPVSQLISNIFKKKIVREDVRFVVTDAFVYRGLRYGDLRVLFKEENVTCRELYFVPLHRRVIYYEQGYNDNDYICMAIGTEKMNILKIFYEVSATKNGSRGDYRFSGDMPLTIEYNKNTHLLRSIAPAEDYDYTEEQLAAIEKFNTLYP